MSKGGRKGGKGGRGRGGLVGLLINIVWFLIICGVILAALQLSGVNPGNIIETTRNKAKEYSECIPAGECGISSIFDDIQNTIKGNGSGGKLDGGGTARPPEEIKLPSGNKSSFDDFSLSKEEKGYRGPSKNEPYVNNAGSINKDASYTMLESVKIVKDKDDKNKDVEYSRKEWKHWTGNKDKPCLNTRTEILHRDAVPGTVKYIDKKKKTTENYKEACAIGVPVEEKGKIVLNTDDAGEWIDPYSGKKITDSRTIDIDHVIPLSNAARQGGQEWSAEKKEEFANDPDNLLATSAKENRSKGDKGPGKYMPPLKSYHCQYAKTYTSLSYKYDLTITESDYKVLNEAIQKCKK